MDSFYDVFISYGRADSKTFAAKLSDRLRAAEKTVWVDSDAAAALPPAVNWQKKIDEDIPKAHNFLFVISPHAVNSGHCKQEIEVALQCKKRIIPLMHVKEISREDWKERHPEGTDSEWEDYRKRICILMLKSLTG